MPIPHSTFSGIMKELTSVTGRTTYPYFLLYYFSNLKMRTKCSSVVEPSVYETLGSIQTYNSIYLLALPSRSCNPNTSSPSPSLPIPPLRCSPSQQQLHLVSHSNQKSWCFSNFLSFYHCIHWVTKLKTVSSNSTSPVSALGLKYPPKWSPLLPILLSVTVLKSNLLLFLSFNILIAPEIMPKTFRNKVILLSPYSTALVLSAGDWS